MRHISFQFTKAQILARTKTVTRRMGWRNLKPGARLQGVEKGMGLKKGEKIVKLAVIEVVSVRREPLINVRELGETDKEGFPEGSPYWWPSEFIRFFCASHKGCTPETEVTRIEFRYVE